MSLFSLNSKSFPLTLIALYLALSTLCSIKNKQTQVPIYKYASAFLSQLPLSVSLSQQERLMGLLSGQCNCAAK